MDTAALVPFVVDLGFSTAKVLYGGRQFRIPSAFRAGMGGAYIYGEDALVKTGSSYLKTPQELIRHYPAFVKLAMERAGAASEEVSLAVGLPYLFWLNENHPGGAVEALTNALAADGYGNVLVLPQGLGGIKSFIHESKGTNGNVLAIDIGFNTVIFTLFDPTRGQMIYGNTYNKRGIHQMANEYVLPRISHLAPARTFTPLEISILIERGTLDYSFEQFDIRGEISQAINDYVTPILDDIYGEVQAELGTHANARHVIMFGGGGALLANSMPANAPFQVLREPEYANARGFSLVAGQ